MDSRLARGSATRKKSGAKYRAMVTKTVAGPVPTLHSASADRSPLHAPVRTDISAARGSEKAPMYLHHLLVLPDVPIALPSHHL